MSVILYRGLPGSGKSHMTNTMFPDAQVFSADHYFLKDGVYQFDYKKLGEAHNQCLNRFTQWLMFSRADTPTAVIDNTNISAVECAPYLQLGLAFGHDIEIITLVCSVETSFKRNIHGVPLKTIESMASRLESEATKFPKWWPHRWVQNL
jgi:predicted kinase